MTYSYSSPLTYGPQPNGVYYDQMSYQKPSAIKKAIYSELVEFVENAYKHFDCDCVREYGIKSYNRFQFTFGALIPVEYNEVFGKDFNYGRFVWCYIEITKMHNRIWAVL